MQALYEKRLATYPRTDSRYLTEDMAPGLPDLCRTVERLLPLPRDQPVPCNADRVIDNSRVTDHHAIIPTSESADADFTALPAGEKNILNLIAVRLLCAVGEAHIYLETAVTIECGGSSFSTKGRAVMSEGWKAVQRAYLDSLKKKPEDTALPELPKLAEGQVIPTVDASIKEGHTSPPARYSDATLLSAMERAGAEEFAQMENVERTGLGTPATRAEIIEKLVERGFATRKGKQVIPTEDGLELIRVMPEQLRSVKLTTQWEKQLGEVERGRLDPAVFMERIVSMLENLVREPLLRSPVPTVPWWGSVPAAGKTLWRAKAPFFARGIMTIPAAALPFGKMTASLR